ncbi:type VII secretion system-associated protein [Streptomyces sp. NPDC001851]|uniref:type VII secretion system-associated protein n=1 Tax=Streptomyces sp. NPDC001851 TaxID=3154529 RepID=UPI003318D248
MTGGVPGSGDRWVAAEHIVDSVVVTGDGNIVIYYADGHHAEPEPPASRTHAERLLFGPEPAAPTDRPWTWLAPEAGLHPLVSRPEEAQLIEWARDGRGTALRLVCAPSGQGKTTLALQVCARLRGLGWTAGVLDLEQTPSRYQGGGGAETGSLARSIRRWDRQLAAVAALPRLSGRALLVVDSAEVHRSRIEELLRTVTELPTAHGVAPVKLLLLARDTGEWWEELSVGSHRHQWIERRVTRLGPVTDGMSEARIGEVWRAAAARFTEVAEQAGMRLAPESAHSITKGRPDVVPTTLHLYAAALLQVLDAAEGRAASLDHREHPIAGLVEHEQRYVAGAFTAAGLPLSHDRARLLLALVCLYAPRDEQAAVRTLQRVEATAAEAELARRARQLQALYPGGDRSLWRAPGPDRLADSVLHTLAAGSRSDTEAERLFGTLCATDDWFEGRDCARVLIRAMGTAAEDAAAAPTVPERIGGALRALILDHPRGYVAAALETAADRFEQQIRAAVSGHSSAAPESRLTIRELEALDLLLPFPVGSDSRARIAVEISGSLVQAATQPWQGEGPWQASARLTKLARHARGLQRAGDPERAATAAQEAVTLARRMRESGDAAVNGRIAQAMSRAGRELAAAGLDDAALEVSTVAVDGAWSSLSSPEPLDTAERAAILNAHALRLYALGRTHAAAGCSAEALSLYGEAAQQHPGRYDLELTGARADYGMKLRAAHRPQQAEPYLAQALAAYRRHLAADDRPGIRHALVQTLRAYGGVLHDLGQTSQAIPYAEEAVELQRALTAQDPEALLDLAGALNQLGSTLAAAGSPEAGRRHLEESVGVLRGMGGDPGTAEELANALANLGTLYGECGDPARAVPLLEEALALRQAQGARPGGSGLATTAHNLAQALHQSGHPTRAQAVRARYLDPRSDDPGPVRTAAEVRAEVPPVTDELRAAARRMAGGYLYAIDPAFDPQGEVPGYGIRGAFTVGADGEITGYETNEHYRPSPLALNFPTPTDPLDEAAQLALTGYGPQSAVERALRSITVAVAKVTTSATADPETAVFSSPSHLPDGITATRVSGVQLLASLPVGSTIHINPASPVPYRFTRTAGRAEEAGEPEPPRTSEAAAPTPPLEAHPQTPPPAPAPVTPTDKVAGLCARYAAGEPVLDLIAAELRRSRVWYVTSGGDRRHLVIASIYDGRSAVFVYSSREYASTDVLSFDTSARLSEAMMSDLLNELPPATYVVLNNEGPYPLQISASALMAYG